MGRKKFHEGAKRLSISVMPETYKSIQHKLAVLKTHGIEINFSRSAMESLEQWLDKLIKALEE